MTRRIGFTAAATTLTSAGLGDDLSVPFVRALEVTGAAISTLGRPLGSQTVCASDATAARIEEIQLDLGEGPCWQALRSRLPVLEPDLQHATAPEWPAALDALRDTEIGALYAFPLFVGSIDVGSIDLYADDAGRFSTGQVEDATALASIAARQVLRRALASIADPEGEYGDGPHSRRELHQASGMVAAQMRVSADDGLMILRGHAFAEGRRVLEVAADVIERRLDFAPDRREDDEG